MARALSAYLSRDKVPERKALQQAIDALLKLPLKFDGEYVPFETSGYLPFTLDGEDAGFFLRFDDVAADVARRPQPGRSQCRAQSEMGRRSA